MRVHRPAVLFLVVLCAASVFAQTPDRNVNMVSGTEWPGGDPWLQRQNEPSIAASTRNPLHLLAGANDYRTVDIPGLEDIKVIGDAWLGVFRSYDGGSTWTSTLMPGYPQDGSAVGMASPLKGYPAGADPVVRAGANGLFYYAGIVLNRDANPLGALFVTRYLDFNNKESSKLLEESAHSIRFVDTKIIQKGTSGQFQDKPWVAVDIPRPGSTPCVVGGEHLDGGNVYVAWTTLVGGDTNIRSKMMVARSTDCGSTWEAPTKLSETHAINQGASIAIHPSTGNVYVVWRRIDNGRETDALIFSKSTDLGRTFSTPTVIRNIKPFEQGTTNLSFRTTAFPSMAVDGNGRIYVAWSERDVTGDGRVALVSSADGVNWSSPALVANHAERGHQFMPTLTFANGKVTAAWYDQRDDHTTGIFTAIEENGKLTGQYSEARRKEGHLATSPALPQFVFNTFIQELASVDPVTGLLRRHTLDVFVAEAAAGVMPVFNTARASQYYFGSRTGAAYTGEIEQMQFSAPNLPLFRQGTTPFIGDYLDVGAAEVMKKTAEGWRFSVESLKAPVRHVVWTDNRDVRPPADGNWRNYTPVTAPGGASLFDKTLQTPACQPGQTGMRNQNIYTTRITNGLFVGSPGNTKPFRDPDTSQQLQRAFVVFVQNTLREERSYRLTIVRQPDRGYASFLQLFPPGSPLTVLDVTVPARSTIARTVFATSADKYDDIEVSVRQIDAPEGSLVPNGLESTVVLNPDIANPDIANPDIANPDIANPDIANAEVYNPDIANPDIANPDIANPDIANPDIANPDIANPDIANPDIANPDIANPDIANPDIANPDIANPDIANGTVTDTTWETTNEGNTAASYSVNLLLTGDVPDGFKTQLILHRIYTTPVARGCERELERHTVLFSNINNPEFDTPEDLVNSDVTDPSATNATIWLLPGETMRITLRVVDPIEGDAITFNAAEQVSPVTIAHAINTENLDDPNPRPPVSFTITTRRVPDALTGIEYVGSQLVAVGGIGTRTWSSGTPAPPASLNISESGFVNGTADVAGSYNFMAVVQDGVTPVPNRDEQSIFIRVVDELIFPEQTLPIATPGAPYSTTLTRQGGAAPFTFEAIDGTPPAGLTLSPQGVISGTTNDSGTFTFTVRVTDSTYPVPQTAQQDISLNVGGLFLIFLNDPPSFIEGQPTPNVAVRVRDGAGAVIPGATVSLTHAPNPCGFTLTPPRVTTTNSDGTGLFTELPSLSPCSGYRYRATASMNGFPTVEQDSQPFDVYGFATFADAGTGTVFHTATLLNDGRVLVNAGSPGPGVQRCGGDLYNISTQQVVGTISGDCRVGHSATLLNDGSVLLAGGHVIIGAADDVTGMHSSYEVFDPQTNTSAHGQMGFESTQHTATLVPDGSVYLIGGRTVSSPQRSIRRYDGTGFTTPATALVTQRYGHSATLVGDWIVVIGGRDSELPLSSVELFNWRTGQISSGGNLQTGRFRHGASLLGDGRILVTGGYTLRGIAASSEIYDPVTRTSTQSSDMLGPHADHVAETLPDGSVLVAGGTSDSDFALTSAVEVFNPSSGTFLPFGSLTNARRRLAGVVVDSPAVAAKLLVFRGEELIDGDLQEVPTVEAFYPAPAKLTVVAQGDLNRAVEGVPYFESLHAVGGVGSRRWSLTSGSLDPGLTLSPEGVISGTPASVGGTTFEVTVEDETAPVPQSATLELALAVDASCAMPFAFETGNSTSWFGGDDRTPGSDRNVGTGQSFTPMTDAAVTSVEIALVSGSLTNATCPRDPLNIRLDLRDGGGNILASSSTTVACQFTGTQWIPFDLAYGLRAGEEYNFTWWLPQGFEQRIWYGSVGEHNGDPIACGQGLGAQNLTGSDLSDWSQWSPHPWDFRIRINTTP